MALHPDFSVLPYANTSRISVHARSFAVNHTSRISVHSRSFAVNHTSRISVHSRPFAVNQPGGQK